MFLSDHVIIGNKVMALLALVCTCKHFKRKFTRLYKCCVTY